MDKHTKETPNLVFKHYKNMDLTKLRNRMVETMEKTDSFPLPSKMIIFAAKLDKMSLCTTLHHLANTNPKMFNEVIGHGKIAMKFIESKIGSEAMKITAMRKRKGKK